MVVDEGQNLLKVEVLLLALHPQVVEGQVNHVHPGQGSKGVGRGEAAATAGASWVQAQGQGQGWDLAFGNGGKGEERSWEGAGVSVGQAPSSHHRRGSLSMYSGPWLHTEQKNR